MPGQHYGDYVELTIRGFTPAAPLKFSVQDYAKPVTWSHPRVHTRGPIEVRSRVRAKSG